MFRRQLTIHGVDGGGEKYRACLSSPDINIRDFLMEIKVTRLST